MQVFEKIKKSNISILYFLLGLPVIIWFENDSFINAGDFGWPQFFKTFFQYTSYVWDSSVNFGYFASRQNAFFFPFAIYGYILEQILAPGPMIEVIIFYISFVFSGLGMYLLALRLGLNTLGAFTCGFFYMFSPYAATIVWDPAYGITFAFYCYLPLNLYLFLLFIETQDTRVKILSLLGTFFSYMGVNFANPAYLVIYFMIIFFFVLYKYIEKNINRKILLINLCIYCIVFLLFNLFWILPFIIDLGNQFQTSSNQAAGLISDIETLKLNSVKIYDAFRMNGFWAMKGEQWGDYYYTWHQQLDSPLYIAVNLIFPLLIIIRFIILNPKVSNLTLVMFILLIIAIILNSGMITGGIINQITKVFYNNEYIIRLFRSVYTKIGILLVIPIVILSGETFGLLFFKIKKFKNQIIIFFVFLTLYSSTIGLPFINGQIIKAQGEKLPGFNVKIPQEYYSLKNLDFNYKLDVRYLSLPIPKSYNHLLKWEENKGYIGADFLRNFLTKPAIFLNDNSELTKALISCINASNAFCDTVLNLMNVSFILSHKDIPEYINSTYLTNSNYTNKEFIEIENNKYFSISKKHYNKNKLLHFYIPDTIYFTDFFSNNLSVVLDTIINQKNCKIAIFQNSSENNLKIKNDALLNNNLTVIEYKKINPVKYRLRIHNANDNFPIVFSEGYHPKWELYLTKFDEKIERSAFQPQVLNNYKIFNNNESDQASFEELKSYIYMGWVTLLGDFKKKEITYKSWTINSEKIVNTDNYSIDFISKKFNGTIQNDNLKNGSIFETWFKNPIKDTKHSIVNGYANKFTLDTKSLCNNSSDCMQNIDGSYDFEIVVEFWPQRLFYIGIFLSGLLIIICIIILFNSCYKFYKNTKFKFN